MPVADQGLGLVAALVAWTWMSTAVAPLSPPSVQGLVTPFITDQVLARCGLVRML
jgi:hypothetical protein